MLTTLRRHLLTRPILKRMRKALPGISDTEREALEAGDVWWDAELFTGNPDWSKLLQTPPVKLSQEEQAFLDGPVEELCGMLNDWEINWERKDLPPEIWHFIRTHKFFAMIIPQQYGGLGFSAYANSQVIRKIASRSVVAAVTVMVPNSLGPGELLMEFGTKAQQDHWLPRLANGTEIPCFGLTSPQAGSDASSMDDNGVICKGTYQGEEMTGIRLNWHKRYITLGPVATVLGLAFKLYDPEHLIGNQDELGITVALIPTDLNGINIGRRHLPCYQMFQNGPNWGKDVFIPLDFVIGGPQQIGKGWQMLMEALAAGRGISLPSLAAAATAFSARTTGAYARIRQQFHIPIGKFEGVQARLGKLAANAYLLDAARQLTCAGLDQGYKLAVISAIMKAHTTYRMRDAINDAMDVHAGKAVIDGPSNYLGNLYRAVPIGITVEGANILTRNMIIFGQGAIRCHPWLLKEILALEEEDQKKALVEFDKAFWGHVAHSTKTLGRAWLRSWTNGKYSPVPSVPDQLLPYYKQLSRYAAAFALVADFAFLTLGGALKRKEMLSARLGDILSELYFISAVLKRWQDDGKKNQDLPLVEYCVQESFTVIENRLDAVFRNLPNRFMAWLARFITMPLGPRTYGPSDNLIRQCAEFLLEPSTQRERLTEGLHAGNEHGAVSILEKAFRLVDESSSITEKMKKARIYNIEQALDQGILSNAEAEKLKAAEAAVAQVIAVDDFDAGVLTGIQKE